MKRRGFLAVAVTLLSAAGLALVLGLAGGGADTTKQRAALLLQRNAAAPGRLDHGNKPPLYHEAGGEREAAAAQA